MSVIFGVLFLAVAGTTLGVPIPETTNVLHGWVPAPRSRGTFNIITSCVVTLVLCVWTAIHPDVLYNVELWQRYKKKIGWMLKALLTPDRVVMHSYNQWQGAKRIHQLWIDKGKVKQRPDALAKHLNSSLLKYGPKINRDDASSSVGPCQSGDLLGIEGAFFLVMGGYITEGKAVSLEGLENLALWQRREVGGQLKRLDVIDKGKASVLAKGISCLQASWLVLQLLARKAAGLPVTQLELHVFVHVLITAGLYWFWWGKPLDVNEPIELLIPFGPGQPSDYIYPKPATKIPKLLDLMDNISLLELFPKAFIWFQKALDGSSEPSHEPSGAPKPPTDSEKAPSANTGALSESSEKSSQSRRPSVEALEVSIGSRETPIRFSKTPSKLTETPTESSNPLAKPSEKGSEVLDILKEYGPSLIFYLLYGGLHTIAWNSQFPTLVELWLWRASCLVVAAAPAGMVIDMCIRCYFAGMPPKDHRGFPHYLLTILYTIGSMFLLVESFIGLRQLPSRAYETVTWGNYIPHF